MNSLTISVPSEQQSDVDSWQDGQQYSLVVKQTGPGQFELVSSGPAGDTETAAGDNGAGADEGAEGGGMHENPAVAVVMMGKKKGA